MRKPVRQALLLLAGALSFAPAPAAAQSATLRGVVRDADTGDPLPFANVVVVGSQRGASTREDGSYVIRGIPAGVHDIQVTYVGYATASRKGVSLPSARSTTLDFALDATPETLEEVTVYGDKSLVDIRNTSSIKTLSAQDIADLTIDPTIENVIGQQAGVTVQDGEIHIRGGRADETLLMVDGVALKDATGGNALAEAFSAASAAEVTVVKGGWDAKYGQAISGIVDVRVKEGTERFKGRVSYLTDAWVGTENLHYGNFQLEGPNPLLGGLNHLFGFDRAKQATFHLDLSTELSDTYLPSVRDTGDDQRLTSVYKGRLLGKSFDYGSFFRPRGDNNWRMTFKTGWGFHPAHKVTATYIKSLGFSGLFNARDIGDVNRNITSYPWAWSRRLGNHYTITDDFYSTSLQWKHSLSDQTYHQLRLKNRFNATHRDVAGKHWSEYTIPFDVALDRVGLGHPYFLDTGDAPDYRDRFTEQWGMDWELEHRTDHHDVTVGFSGEYEDVQYFTLDAYSVTEDDPLGQEYDLFHVYPAKGSVFIQDQIEYTGISLKVGLRGDVFFPGEQVERLYEEQDRPSFTPETKAEWDAATHEAFGRRYKVRWSPRVAVSHPISDRSHFFFNYGRFTQWPSYFFLYAKTGGISSEEFPNIGNPNLDPEISANYEFGVGHNFTDRSSLRATVFFKDIYDYPTSVPVDIATRSTRRERFFIYRNLDYARARGLEIELQKRRSKHTWVSVGYSFSVATGKSSDPNNLALVQSLGGDARETDLEEQFMWWNRPHKITVSAGYQVDADQRGPKLFGWRLPSDWKLSLFWLLQSGEAYTKITPEGVTDGKEYSRNGPTDSVLDLDFSKKLSIGGRRITLSIQARNLLNHRSVLDIDPVTGRSPRSGVGSYTGSASDLFITTYAVRETDADPSDFLDVNRSLISSLTSVRNPAFIAAPRTIRMGLSYAW